MIKFRKILVPTDFSESSISAYTHAQEVAQKYGAVIDFIHVIPTLQYFNESLSKLGVPLDDGDLYPTVQKEVKHHLEEDMDDYIQEEFQGEAIAKIDRKASHAITEVARTGGYDLIIMAALGKHGSDLLRGTTTEQVIRHSEVPVFTVDGRRPAGGFKRILLPTDASEISFSALPVALSLALIYEAEITLFHVAEMYGRGIEEASESTALSEEGKKYEAIIGKLRDYLATNVPESIEIIRGETEFEDQLLVTEGADSQTVNIYTVIEKDISAHHGIEEYAADNADLVVMATHGHSGFAHFFLGSTTEKVAQHLNLPVVTVKPDKKMLNQKKS